MPITCLFSKKFVFYKNFYKNFALEKEQRDRKYRKKKNNVVEWLKYQTDDQHGLGSKPTCAILLCLWERHFTALPLLGGLDKQF